MCTFEGLSLAIIDSGVDVTHSRFHNDIFCGFQVTETGVLEDYSDQNGHGTAIYGILQSVTSHFQIINIKIVNEFTAREQSLIRALRYCLENRIDLINISAGVTVCFTQELEDLCYDLEQKGSIVISAFANDGSVSYPAAYSSVIGVDSGDLCFTKNEIEYVEGSIVNIRGYGRIQRLCWTTPPMLLMGGSSFACAHVTSIIADLMRQGYRQKQEILSQLKQRAKCVWNASDSQGDIKLDHTICKAAIFPFNKEMHSLIRFHDLLTFKITDVYDVKYSGHVGATTGHLLGIETDVDLKIQNIDKIDWGKIDTLIIGHLEQLSSAINYRRLLLDLLRQAQAHDVFVYAFDDLNPLLSELDHVPDLFFPYIDSKNLPPFQFGKLYRISKPVLGVFGTSSKQGKFTVQLELRRRFLNAGYLVGQIGTEPTSLLYGMDCVFPSGYHSTVHLDRYDVVRYLNNEVNRLCQNNEIILVGSQSGTVSYDLGNLKQVSLTNYEFLLGTQPDAIILCVNSYDSVEYLERTIHLLESAVRCRVIAFVLFPLKLKSDWAGIYGGKTTLDAEEILQIKEQLFQKFERPVFCLGVSEEMDQLAQLSVEFFAADSNS